MKKAIVVMVAGGLLGGAAAFFDPFIGADAADPTRVCVSDQGTWHCYLPEDAPEDATPVYYGPQSMIQDAWAAR